MSRLNDLNTFYQLLDELARRTGGPRTLDAVGQYHDWPMRGVYFFFDPRELRSQSGSGARIVRVGTHALKVGSKSTLRQRLSQHRGNVSGGGNHRGSIFRLLVGQALIANGSALPCETWGIRSDKRKAAEAINTDRAALDAAEAPVENAVSAYLASLPFLWLEIDDVPSPASTRSLIERNAIALLSNHGLQPVDAPSANWLGHHSNRPLVQQSGLWNQNHVTETHDPEFLTELENLVLSR